MEKLPKISIITPTLNAGETIEACILSVKNQTYSNKEHLIIDGQSTDGTLEIIRKHANNYSQLKWISEKDGGIYDAMNKGIDLSSGDWLYFLGSDDVFYSNTILSDIFYRVEVAKFDVIYGNVTWGDMGQLYDGPFSKGKLLQKNICHQAIFTKKTVFDKVGKFYLKYKILADWVFNMQWFNNEDIRHCYIDITIAKYCLDGSSANKFDIAFIADKDALIETYFPGSYSFFQKELNNKEHKIAELQHILTKMIKSRSWQIARPLRQLGDIIGKCCNILGNWGRPKSE